MIFIHRIKFENNINTIKDYLDEDLVYNFNVGVDIDEISFKSDNASESEFVIGGVSLVRRKNEVTILLQVGEIVNPNIDYSKENIDFSKVVCTPGKEELTSAKELKHERVLLHDNPEHLKVLIVCRFDLETKTIDAKYLAKDMGDSFSIITDDIDGFLNTDGIFYTPDIEKVYKYSLDEIKKYSSLYEVAKSVLFLPYYFEEYEKNVIYEEHETKYKVLSRSPIAKKKYRKIKQELRISSRSLCILNIENKFSSDRIVIREDKFKIETSGYWKRLSPDEFGMDKKGKQITGKTWVHRKDSYYEANTNEFIVSKRKAQKYTGKNAGYIYVMRNPTLPENTFKIGLTTVDAKARSKQLSKTSIPDKHYVMREWNVKDCYKAEKEIHNILDEYRVDPRREFFNLEMEEVNNVIDDVVNKINN